MANRALLYSSDNGDYTDPDNWEYPHEKPLCDSRWTFPVAWFFFFHESDVNATDEEEIKFLADKRRALMTFEQRLPLLLDLVGSRYESRRIIAEFTERVREWPGNYLLVEPRQIFQDFPEEDLAYCLNVLQMIDRGNTRAEEVIKAAKRYCGFDYPNEDEFVEQVVGICYRC